jgi:hypothetical protein
LNAVPTASTGDSACADLAGYHAHGYPHAPDTGFAAHYAGISGYPVQFHFTPPARFKHSMKRVKCEGFHRLHCFWGRGGSHSIESFQAGGFMAKKIRNRIQDRCWIDTNKFKEFINYKPLFVFLQNFSIFLRHRHH